MLWALWLAWFSLLAPADAMSSARRRELRDLARETWRHGWEAYRRHAFPADELRPLSCRGQGSDKEDPRNYDINDVMGDYSLTLVDSLDTFVIMDDRPGFEAAVRDVIRHVSFDQDAKVQVFEVTIRCLGGLLSGHILASEARYGYAIAWYQGELLTLARDLGRRLLPAFDASMTGLPYARINLRHGIMAGETFETCSAGAGSLMLEFATLSRLTGDESFERVARKAFFAVWNRKSELSLIGNTINLATGQWTHPVASTGAGIDSMYEYMLKSYILLADDEFFRVWDEANAAVLRHVRSPEGFVYRGVHMVDGKPVSQDIDSLGAFWAGLQVLAGDVESAIRAHLVYVRPIRSWDETLSWRTQSNIWQRYSGMPETFHVSQAQAISLGYPLRPEFIESTYMLHRATDDAYYLRVGERVLTDIVNRTRVECGLASLKDVTTGELDDRMHSFALSETLRYSYMLFDAAAHPPAYDGNAVYTTEGHLLTMPRAQLRQPPRRRRGESPVCPAYAPADADMYWTPLKLGIEGRVDAEYARMLAGHQVDEAEALATALWSPDGFCHAPRLADFSLELLFTAGNATEDVAPGLDKVRVVDEGLLVTRVAGLRFTMQRRWDAAYDVVRVAQYRVPKGGRVLVADRLLAISMTTAVAAPARVRLRFSGAALEAAAQPASFGLDFGQVLHAMPLAVVRLVDDANAHGCLDHPVLGPAVVVVRRGECTFGRKAVAVRPHGIVVVLVVDHDGHSTDDSLPVADGDPTLPMGVPVALVTHATGEAVRDLVRGLPANETLSVQLVGAPPPLAGRLPQDGPVVLNGQRIANVRLVEP